MFLIISSFFIFVCNYVVFCKFVSNSYIIIVILNIKMSTKKSHIQKQFDSSVYVITNSFWCNLIEVSSQIYITIDTLKIILLLSYSFFCLI